MRRRRNRVTITVSALAAGCLAAIGLALVLARADPSDPNLGVCLVIAGGIVVTGGNAPSPDPHARPERAGHEDEPLPLAILFGPP